MKYVKVVLLFIPAGFFAVLGIITYFAVGAFMIGYTQYK